MLIHTHSHTHIDTNTLVHTLKHPHSHCHTYTRGGRATTTEPLGVPSGPRALQFPMPLGGGRCWCAGSASGSRVGTVSPWHVREAPHGQTPGSGHLAADACLQLLRLKGLHGCSKIEGQVSPSASLGGAYYSWLFYEMAGKHSCGPSSASPSGAPLGSRPGSGFPGTLCQGYFQRSVISVTFITTELKKPTPESCGVGSRLGDPEIEEKGAGLRELPAGKEQD